jgi:ABC-type nitrate/sulfonate/bicarbonate transport system ATPase subunit
MTVMRERFLELTQLGKSYDTPHGPAVIVDVDEALLLADRVVMMTSGPAATVGERLTVPFPRPRSRVAVLQHPPYYPLRDQLIGFLEERAAA